MSETTTNLINHDAIPESLMPDMRAICAVIGPQLLGSDYPGSTDPDEMTMEQCNASVEAITREFWRQQIQSYRANKAAEEARQAAAAEVETDPFA